MAIVRRHLFAHLTEGVAFALLVKRGNYAYILQANGEAVGRAFPTVGQTVPALLPFR
jgi:hypothetical protein